MKESIQIRILKVQNILEQGSQMFAIKAVAVLLFTFCGNVFASTFFFDGCSHLILSSEEERNALELSDYHKNLRVYKRADFVLNCDDSLSSDYIEVDPRPCRGIFPNTTVPKFSLDSLRYIDINYYKARTFKTETFQIYTYGNETKTFTKDIHIKCGDFSKTISESWNKDKLTRIRYNDVNRSIVERTPCYLKILEPKGEDVIIRIDPEKEPPALVHKVVVDSGEVYEAIKYHWYLHCKKYHESKNLAASLSSEELSDLTKDNDDSLPYPLPYKYYLIIAAFTMVAIVAIIYKRRKAGK
jgi:hypothetical protein